MGLMIRTFDVFKLVCTTSTYRSYSCFPHLLNNRGVVPVDSSPLCTLLLLLLLLLHEVPICMFRLTMGFMLTHGIIQRKDSKYSLRIAENNSRHFEGTRMHFASSFWSRQHWIAGSFNNFTTSMLNIGEEKGSVLLPRNSATAFTESWLHRLLSFVWARRWLTPLWLVCSILIDGLAQTIKAFRHQSDLIYPN